MAHYYKKRVELYRRNTDLTWDKTPTIVLDDAFNISIVLGMGDRKDTARFSLVNARGKYFDGTALDGFALGDNVKIYFSQDREVNTDTDLAFDGMIVKPPQVIGDRGKMINVTCRSRTEYLFEALVLIDKQNSTPDAVVKEIIAAVNNFNSNVANFQIGSDIVSTKSDGSAFATVSQFGGIYKQANLLLEQISSVEYTQDPRGSYIYYVDANNVFHWTYRSATPSSSTITEGVEPKSLKIDFDKEEVVNMIIMSVGDSPDGTGNTILVPDYVSITRNGIKARYITSFNRFTSDLVANEINNNPDSFDTDSTPFPTAAALSAGYTTFWVSTRTDSKNQPTTTKGSVVTGIGSTSEFNFAVEREATWRGEIVGKQIINNLKNPRFKVTVELSRTLSYNIADLISVTIPSNAIENLQLRCVAITHTDKSTTLELIEDPNPT